MKRFVFSAFVSVTGMEHMSHSHHEPQSNVYNHMQIYTDKNPGVKSNAQDTLSSAIRSSCLFQSNSVWP